tara:strand:- start:70 stop:663 length:594 start_codon:yes stop_codon:yes gene_type:complete
MTNKTEKNYLVDVEYLTNNDDERCYDKKRYAEARCFIREINESKAKEHAKRLIKENNPTPKYKDDLDDDDIKIVRVSCIAHTLYRDDVRDNLFEIINLSDDSTDAEYFPNQHYMNKCELVERLIDYQVAFQRSASNKHYLDELFELIKSNEDLQKLVATQLVKLFDTEEICRQEVREINLNNSKMSENTFSNMKVSA